MISISGKYWEELKVEKRLIDKAKIDHNLNTTQAKLIISRILQKKNYYQLDTTHCFQIHF